MAIRRALLALGLFAARALARSWYIDPSCDEKNIPMNDVLEEAVETANMIMEGLESADPKMLTAFKQIFKMDYKSGGENQAHTNRFEGVMTGKNEDNIVPGGVTTMKKSDISGDSAWAPSDLRIYCNNYGGWKLRADDDRLGFKQPESDDEKVWYNPANGMTFQGRLGRDLGHAATSSGMIHVFKKPDQPDDRVVIDVNDLIITPNRRWVWPETFPQKTKGFQLPNGPYVPAIMIYRQIGSMLMLHELTHSVSPWFWRTLDLSYHWTDSPTDEAVMTADKYMYLGIAARLFKTGLSLDPSGSGDFVLDEGTTKRDADPMDSGSAEPDFETLWSPAPKLRSRDLLSAAGMRAPHSVAMLAERRVKRGSQGIPRLEGGIADATWSGKHRVM